MKTSNMEVRPSEYNILLHSECLDAKKSNANKISCVMVMILQLLDFTLFIPLTYHKFSMIILNLDG
jgi:hypothetical protein